MEGRSWRMAWVAPIFRATIEGMAIPALSYLLCMINQTSNILAPINILGNDAIYSERRIEPGHAKVWNRASESLGNRIWRFLP